jgi:hypothetical protein
VADLSLKPLPERKVLFRFLDRLHERYKDTIGASSWFVLDARGTLLAVSPDLALRQSQSLLNTSFAYRDYFHGWQKDLNPESPGYRDPPPLTRPHLSIVFESKLTGHPRRVVFSVPVRRGSTKSEVIGVLCMAVDVGAFMELQVRKDQIDEFPVLVDTREDWEGRRGLILQHPDLEHFRNQENDTPRVRLTGSPLKMIVDLVNGPPGKVLSLTDYQDPFGKRAEDFQGTWLVVAKPVRVALTEGEDGSSARVVVRNTGWVVFDQARYAPIIQPVEELRRELIRESLIALGVVIALMMGLWAFVFLVLNDSSRSRLAAYLRKRAGLAPSGLSGHAGSGAARTGSLTGGKPEKSGSSAG